jgi:uncharacterized protein involved in outer membrane biogenesis
MGRHEDITPIQNRAWPVRHAVAGAGGLVVFVLTFDWNRARPWINQRVSESLGREFAINGDLRVHWEQGDSDEGLAPLRAAPAHQRRQRQHRQSGMEQQPAAGQRRQHRGRAASAAAAAQGSRITDLAVDKVNVDAERRADGSNNWTFKDNGPATWSVDIQRLTLGEGKLRYLDDTIKLDLRAEASGINEGADAEKYGLRFDLSGSYRNAPVTGGGKVGKSCRCAKPTPASRASQPTSAKQNRHRRHRDRPARARRP